jgi:hypothetical protein
MHSASKAPDRATCVAHTAAAVGLVGQQAAIAAVASYDLSAG